MDIKKIVILLLFLPAPLFLPAQELSETAGEENLYYFSLQDDGNPLFMQIIEWDAVSGALGYELIIQDSENEIVFEERAKEPSREISLEPGEYRYAVIIYNMLDKPEFQTPWIPLVIIKAEIPRIDKLSPPNLYIEEEDYQIILEGSNITVNSRYFLINQTSEKELGELNEIIITKEGVVKINLPDDLCNPGKYSVRVINPGGIDCMAPDEFRIRYLKPFDISVSAGYNPYIPIYDSWFTETWDESVYPEGFLARADLILLKKAYGYFGLELQGSTLNLEGGPDEALIKSNFTAGGVNMLYKFIISSKIHLLLRAGGGAVRSTYFFDYEGVLGEEFTSWDTYITSGLSLQYYFNRYIFLEGGTDWNHIMFKTYDAGGMTPHISLGFCY